MSVADIRHFACTIPNTATPAAPSAFPLALPALLDVIWLEWTAPAGLNGQVGFWIGSHGQQVIPFGSGPANWIVATNESRHWDLDPDAFGWEDWELVGYNTGFTSHTIYLTFGLAYPAAEATDAGMPSLTVLNS